MAINRGLLISSVANFIAYSCWTLLNKWQFSPRRPTDASPTEAPPAGTMWGYGVTTPIFVTGIQMIIAGLTAAFTIFVLGIQRRPRLQGGLHHASHDDGAPPAPELFSWATLRARILPLGLARSIDIGCANAALVTVSVAVQQVIKSLLPVFVSFLSITVLKVPVSRSAWVALIPVVSGTLMATMRHSDGASSTAHAAAAAAAAAVPWTGVALATISCFARSFKAVLNAKLLKPPGKQSRTASSVSSPTVPTTNGGSTDMSLPPSKPPSTAAMMPLEILLLEAPTSGIILVLVAICFERQALVANWGAVASAGLLNLVGGLLMFVNQWSYITVIEKSSAVTCQVVMNAKMLTLVLVSVYLFGTPFSNANYAGVLVAASGCVLYSVVTSRGGGGVRRIAGAKSRSETV